jgi:hypothetical protein
MGKIDTVGNVTNALLRAVVIDACLAKRKCISFSQMGYLGYSTSWCGNLTGGRTINHTNASFS